MSADRRLLPVGGALVLVLALAGCSSEPPRIDTPDLDETGRTACADLVAALPDTLVEESQVDVEPADALGAAWGDPAITLTCGVDQPEGFDRLTSSCEVASDIGWYLPPEQFDDRSVDLTIYSVTRDPIVELVVPSDYRPSDRTQGDDTVAAALVELAPAINDHSTLLQDCI